MRKKRRKSSSGSNPVGEKIFLLPLKYFILPRCASTALPPHLTSDSKSLLAVSGTSTFSDFSSSSSARAAPSTHELWPQWPRANSR
jgi:hypothetical protein